MGVFQDMVQIKNLAPIPLTCVFDGQQTQIPVGLSFLPKVALIYAMNQNPIMGTASPTNPSASGGQFLIVAVGSKFDREPLTKEEWEAHLRRPCRMDEEALFGDLGPKEHVVTRGKGRTQAKSSNDLGVRPEPIGDNIFATGR